MQKTKPDLKLGWATHKAAKYACENWHYSGCLPVPPLVKVGVWENEKYIGCLIFSRGASPSLFKPFNLEQTQGCELTRVALTDHITPVSRLMSIAFKFLKKSNPDLELIVSFADPAEGHHGGIYQATNWIYTGESSKSYSFLDKTGRKWHSRQVSEKGWNIQQGVKRKCVKPSECTKIENPGKHRYILPLKDRKKYLHLSKEYPKRLEHESNASPLQVEESGAIPTKSLQFKEGN